MDCPLIKMLPCMQEYYNGTSNYKKNHCLEKKKCEYLNGMCNFIIQCYPKYVITECCDAKNDKPYPEAILTNLKNNSTIAIEMKCFPDKVYENVKKTDRNNQKEATFWKKIIDQCAIDAQNLLKEFLKEVGIKDKSYIEKLLNFIFVGINVKIISKSQENVKTILMKCKHHNKQKAFISDNMFLFSKNLLMDLATRNNPSLIETFENDKLEVIIYLSKKDTIYFEIHDNSLTQLRNLNQLNTDGITDYLKKFLSGCEKKFSNVTVDKNILLLDNNFLSDKRDETIQKCLETLSVPSCVNEIWICKKEYDDEYDEEGDYDYTYIYDISYEKIYNSSSK